MSSIESHQRIGRRSLIGATTVEVGIDWVAEANADLSTIENRRAKSITLGFRFGLDYESLLGEVFGVVDKSQGEGHLRLDVEHAQIVRDLLTTAIDATTKETR